MKISLMCVVAIAAGTSLSMCKPCKSMTLAVRRSRTQRIEGGTATLSISILKE
jgi:hypothetical protein